MPEQFVLGFDFGTKRIGVAVGQTLLKQATPLTTISAKDGVPDWNVIRKLIIEWAAEILIVGIPLTIAGKPQSVTAAAKRFVEQLQAHFNLPVYQVDERLTTVEARQRIFENGGFRQLKKEKIDSIAAKLILEQWMNTTV